MLVDHPHIRRHKKESLSAASYNALGGCEKIFRALGLEMTTGTELEWWAMEPLEPVRCDQWIDTKFKELRNRNQEAFDFVSQKNTRWRLSNHGHNIYDLLCCAIEMRMAEECIPCYKSHDEQGTIKQAVTYVTPEGDKYRTTGQRMEVCPDYCSPMQQAWRLEKVRKLVKEECQALGLFADFHSKPRYTYITDDGITLNDPYPGASQHVHFGLRFTDAEKNALVTDTLAHNALSAAIDKHVFELLQKGGQLLANPLNEDYDRFRYPVDTTPRILGNYSNTRKMVYRQFVPDSKPERINRHKEMRIIGNSVPPATAVLLPTLAVVDTLLDAIEKRPEPDSRMTLSDIADSITDADREKIKAMSQQKESLPKFNLGPVETSWANSARTLKPDSAIARYAPNVYDILEQLDGKSL